MLTVVSVIIQRENLSRGRKWFYIINNVVQLLILFLCNSRTSLFSLCFYVVILVVLMSLPGILHTSEKPARRKKIGQTVFVSVVLRWRCSAPTPTPSTSSRTLSSRPPFRKS